MAAGREPGSFEWFGRIGKNDGIARLGFWKRSRWRSCEHATRRWKSWRRRLGFNEALIAVGGGQRWQPSFQSEREHPSVNTQCGPAFNAAVWRDAVRRVR